MLESRIQLILSRKTLHVRSRGTVKPITNCGNISVYSVRSDTKMLELGSLRYAALRAKLENAAG
jgi:hypothetical protein